MKSTTLALILAISSCAFGADNQICLKISRYPARTTSHRINGSNVVSVPDVKNDWGLDYSRCISRFSDFQIDISSGVIFKHDVNVDTGPNGPWFYFQGSSFSYEARHIGVISKWNPGPTLGIGIEARNEILKFYNSRINQFRPWATFEISKIIKDSECGYKFGLEYSVAMNRRTSVATTNGDYFLWYSNIDEVTKSMAPSSGLSFFCGVIF